MGLQGFEQRLERLVEGVFAKTFRSGLKPVEVGRRLTRDMDLHRTLGVNGPLAPNHFSVSGGQYRGLSGEGMVVAWDFGETPAEALLRLLTPRGPERRAASFTFSCDIAYSESPAASRASAF